MSRDMAPPVLPPLWDAPATATTKLAVECASLAAAVMGSTKTLNSKLCWSLEFRKKKQRVFKLEKPLFLEV